MFCVMSQRPLATEHDRPLVLDGSERQACIMLNQSNASLFPCVLIIYRHLTIDFFADQS